MKKLFFYASLFLLVLGYSCQSDFFETEKWVDDSTGSLDDGLTVSAAKQFFENSYYQLDLPNFKSEKASEKCTDANCTEHSHAHDTPPPATRSLLPELKKSNIVIEWDKSIAWSDERASYVEVPLNVGGQLYALKQIKEAHKTMTHERTKAVCSLLIRKFQNQTSCVIVTMMGHKLYLRKAKKETISVKTMKDIGFSGYMFYSDLAGNVRTAYRVENGEKVSFLRRMEKTESNSIPASSNVVSVSLFDMGVNSAAYTLTWELCDWCGKEHDIWEDCPDDLWEGPGCGSLDPKTCTCYCPHCGFKECICYPVCVNCHNPIDACVCCPVCGVPPSRTCRVCGQCYDHCGCCKVCNSNPCECNLCKTCYKDPCICEK